MKYTSRGWVLSNYAYIVIEKGCVSYAEVRVFGLVFSDLKIRVRENLFSDIFCAVVFLLFYLRNLIFELFMICDFLLTGFN